MEIVLLIVVSIVLLVIVSVLLIVLKNNRKRFYRNDVHISGGANVETGQVSSDNNYFKGLTGDSKETVALNAKRKKTAGMLIMICNLNAATQTNIVLNSSLVLGRCVEKGVFTVYGDNMISKRHCELSVHANSVFVSDLKSRNHTYVNGNIVLRPTVVTDADVITIGKTNLRIVY